MNPKQPPRAIQKPTWKPMDTVIEESPEPVRVPTVELKAEKHKSKAISAPSSPSAGLADTKSFTQWVKELTNTTVKDMTGIITK